MEDGEDKLKEEIVDLKSEVARLSGVEELLNDRISYLEGENSNLVNEIRKIETKNDSLNSELED